MEKEKCYSSWDYFVLEEIKCLSSIFQLHISYSKCKEVPCYTSPNQSLWVLLKIFHKDKNVLAIKIKTTGYQNQGEANIYMQYKLEFMTHLDLFDENKPPEQKSRCF